MGLLQAPGFAAAAALAFSGYHQLIFGKGGREGLRQEIRNQGFSLLLLLLALLLPLCGYVCERVSLLPPD